MCESSIIVKKFPPSPLQPHVHGCDAGLPTLAGHISQSPARFRAKVDYCNIPVWRWLQQRGRVHLKKNIFFSMKVLLI